MKKYPLETFEPVLFWPMDVAERVKSKAVKVLCIVWYPAWFILLLPMVVPLLVLSIAMEVWDDVNQS